MHASTAFAFIRFAFIVLRWLCTVEADNAVRLGFNQVQGVRREHAAELEARRAVEPFTSLHDFRRRTHFSQAELRSLARLGALNSFCGHRRAALWQIEQRPPPRTTDFLRRAIGRANLSPLQPMNSAGTDAGGLPDTTA